MIVQELSSLGGGLRSLSALVIKTFMPKCFFLKEKGPQSTVPQLHREQSWSLTSINREQLIFMLILVFNNKA